MAMGSGTNRLGLLCLLAFIFLLLAVSLWIFPSCTDHYLHPEHAVKLKAGEQCWNANIISGYAALDEYFCDRAYQLGDPDGAPGSCLSITATDVVHNLTEAQHCLEFCRQRLGPGLAAPLQFGSPGSHCYLRGNASKNSSEAYRKRADKPLQLFRTCLKARLGEVAGTVMDSWWCPWALAVFYRTLGLCWALYRYRHSSPPTPQLADHEAPDPQFCKPDGPFPNGYLGLPFCFSCCYVTSDQEGARCKLWMALFSILTEPLFDVVSMVPLYLF